ncbi:hypothetical protein BgiMline_029210 [Biomphalaria glabrata]|nr:hypothetical protein BgiMline_025834 [Biomphalaria glabrata]
MSEATHNVRGDTQRQRRHTTSEATHVRGDTTSEATHKVKGDTQRQRRHTTSEATHNVRGDTQRQRRHTTSEATHNVRGDTTSEATQRQRRHTKSKATHNVRGDTHNVRGDTHNVRGDTHTMTHSHEMKTGSPLISPTIFLGSISLTERSGNHSRVHALTQLARHPIRKVHSRTNLPKVASLHPNYVIKPSRSG